MEHADERATGNVADEELLLGSVICGDAELLYIDSWLTDLFRPQPARSRLVD